MFYGMILQILETNKSNLRLQAIAGFTSEELRTRSRNTNIDAASCASLRLNHARFNKNEKVLQHDFGALETQTSPTKSLSMQLDYGVGLLLGCFRTHFLLVTGMWCKLF